MLGAATAGASDAEVMLLAVEPDLMVVIPGLDWKAIRRETQRMLKHTRDSVCPDARLKTQVDLSTARGLKRLDCNPLLAGPDGATIVDARVRVEVVDPPPPVPSLSA